MIVGNDPWYVFYLSHESLMNEWFTHGLYDYGVLAMVECCCGYHGYMFIMTYVLKWVGMITSGRKSV